MSSSLLNALFKGHCVLHKTYKHIQAGTGKCTTFLPLLANNSNIENNINVIHDIFTRNFSDKSKTQPHKSRQRTRDQSLPKHLTKSIKNGAVDSNGNTAYKLIEELRNKEQELRDLRGDRDVGIIRGDRDIDDDASGPLDYDDSIDRSMDQFARRDLSKKKELFYAMQQRQKAREKKRLDQQLRRRERAVRLQQRAAEKINQEKLQLQRKKVNNEIQSQYIILINEDGEKVGRTLLSDAIDMCNDKKGYVVMQMNEPKKNTDPIIGKLIHYGKYKLELQQKEKEKKSTMVKDIKMMRIMTRIDTHDLEIKIKKICNLLEDNHPVRLSIIGNDRSVAYALLKSMINGIHGENSEYAISIYGTLQSPMTMDKNFVIINPYTQQQREKLLKDKEKSPDTSNIHRHTDAHTPTVTPHAPPTSSQATPTPNIPNPNKRKTPSLAADVEEANKMHQQRKSHSA